MSKKSKKVKNNPHKEPAKETAEEDNERPLSDIIVGETDGLTGNMIIYIVYSTRDFIVSIDSEMNLNWQTGNSYENYAPDFGEVLGSCELTEALIDRIFLSKKDKFAYKKMLGSVIARLLDDKDSISARKILAIVDQRINEHGKEQVRMTYIYYAIATVLVVGIILTAIVLNKENLFVNGLDTYKVILCTLLGGIGAFITTFARFKSYTGSLVAGLGIHRLDGFLRVFYGLVAGLIMILGIKANTIMGFANGDNENNNGPWIYYFFAMIAGASEILIPNLIAKSEGELGIKKLEEQEKIKEKENQKGKEEEKKGKG